MRGYERNQLGFTRLARRNNDGFIPNVLTDRGAFDRDVGEVFHVAVEGNIHFVAPCGLTYYDLTIGLSR